MQQYYCMAKSQRFQIKTITKFLFYLVGIEICPLKLSIVKLTQLCFHICVYKKKLNNLLGGVVVFSAKHIKNCSNQVQKETTQS